MKLSFLTIALLLCCCSSAADRDDWYSRHPMPAKMKALVELPAKDALAICRRDLLGKDHPFVRDYLGVSDLNHGDGEFVYHPVRVDGSMWILLVEFDDSGVAFAIYADELSSADKNRPNQRPDGTPVKSPPSNPGQVSGVPHP